MEELMGGPLDGLAVQAHDPNRVEVILYPEQVEPRARLHHPVRYRRREDGRLWYVPGVAKG